MPSFRHRPQPEEQRAHEVVRLCGEMDAHNTEIPRRLLLDAIDTGCEVLEVDLSQVTYLSRAGCGPLFSAIAAAHASGTRLVVSHASSQARTTLTGVGMRRFLSDADGDSQ
jgi:anti-anti-sigma factor